MSFHPLLLTLFLLHISLILTPKALGQNKKYYSCYISSSVYLLKNDSMAKDIDMSNLIQKYKSKLTENLEQIIVFTQTPLSKSQPESTLGNWICDVVKNNLIKGNQKVDACVINYGSIGKDYIEPGAIKWKDFYEIIPNENKIILVSLNGQVLQNLCDSIAQMNGMPLSGISFQIKDKKATNIIINQQPLNEHLIYTVAINDYLFYHKSLQQLFNNVTYRNSHLSLRKILINEGYLLQQKNEKINMKLENRIGYAD